MNTRIARCIVVFLFLSLCLATAVVAEEKEPQKLIFMEEVFVRPDKIEQLEALLKRLQEPAATHGMVRGWDVYSTDDMRYVITVWVDGFAGVDTLYSEWDAFGERWGKEKYTLWFEEWDATYDHFKDSLWRPRPDLSYMPENPPKENSFFYWGVLTVKPGHMKAVEKGFQDYVQLYTEHEVPDHAWNAAVGDIGTDSPTLGYLEWAGSAGAFFTRVDELHANEELKKPSDALWAEMATHIRGYEYVTGQYRADLSWHPEKKAAATEEE